MYPVEERGLRMADLAVGYPARRGRPARVVLTGLDASAAAGDLTVLIGPNGAGKSTLLRTLAGLQQPLAGSVVVDGADITAVGRAELARRLAVVLTKRDLSPLLSTRELATPGRYPHAGPTDALTSADHAAVTRALAAVDAAHLAHRRFGELSDVDGQRVLIARALAQQPAVVLLDEPTAFLDASSRVAVLELLRGLARDRGLTVIASTHDLELALRLADRVWLIDRDAQLRSGTPEELTDGGVIAATFDGDEPGPHGADAAFTLRGRTVGTARLSTSPDSFPVLERALHRQGWHVVASGAADMAVEQVGDGYLGGYDGHTEHHTTLGEFTAWARRAMAVRPAGGWPVQAADPEAVTAALLDAAELGPFFAITTGPAEDADVPGHADTPEGPAWRPVADMYPHADQVRDLVETTARRLGTREARVAASMFQFGFAARVWSPALGCAVGHGIVPEFASLRHRPGAGGPVPLWLPRLRGWLTDDPARLAGLVYREVVDGHLGPLITAVRQAVKIAEPLLWGNAASALAGALRVLVHARPDLEAPARDLADRLLGSGRPRGTGTLTGQLTGRLTSPPMEFLRRNCCLYYRVPGGGTCGDCPLDAPTPTPSTVRPR